MAPGLPFEWCWDFHALKLFVKPGYQVFQLGDLRLDPLLQSREFPVNREHYWEFATRVRAEPMAGIAFLRAYSAIANCL